MFTGIVQGTAQIRAVEARTEARRLTLAFPAGATDRLIHGASVAVSGVCLTAVGIEGSEVSFDVIDETLARTTLGAMAPGDRVNFERAARIGDEIGGHLLSGHVWGTVEVVERRETEDNRALALRAEHSVMRYVFEKGFVGLDGVSLTVGRIEPDAFWVHLIPETLAITTLGDADTGTRINLEADAMTQAVVETTERVLAARFPGG
ncbi:MAG TPA: riboflavin synthase subunit alpha [Deltaproteobacteria bacterium]|nr:riboflavin synthase subunit alpha [Deltaproteobacteria bacterium]